MDNKLTTITLGKRYRLDFNGIRPGTAEPHIMHGLDTLSGQKVQVTRVLLPETLSADDPAQHGISGSSLGVPPTDQNVRNAVAAVRALTRLPDHPRLTQVFDVLVEGEALWIVSERVTARRLSDLLAEWLPTHLRTAEIAREILRALRHLHTYGWFHGNITANMLLICDNGSVVLDGLGQSVAEEALCGFPPRLLPYHGEGETTRRPLDRSETSAVSDGHTSPSLLLGFLPARGASGWAALQADVQRQPATDCQPDWAGTPSTPRQPLPEALRDTEDDIHVAPLTPLEARRARDERIVRIGAVTERWAPEQATPILNGTWRLAPPVGPAVDLWALGALLFRVHQGHPPYPEEDVDELVAMVCAEPPAFAEGCGELRPVVESLLRQDAERRPSFAEVDGWLLTLLRDAREPAPPSDEAEESPRSRRLPVLRSRGHLVRRRPVPVAARRGRHLHADAALRRHGRTLLVVVLPLALGATAYAALELSRTGEADGPQNVASSSTPAEARESVDSGHHDPAGFRIDIGREWKRQSESEQSRVRFTRDRDGLTLIVVPGRDSISEHPTPLDYQKTEPELAAYRADPNGIAEGVRRVDIGAERSFVEGQYVYTDAAGSLLYARNQVIILDGRYHVLFVQGSATKRARVTDAFEQVVTSYRPKEVRR